MQEKFNKDLEYCAWQRAASEPTEGQAQPRRGEDGGVPCGRQVERRKNLLDGALVAPGTACL